MGPVVFGLSAIISTIYLVVGVLLLCLYEDKVMESESRVIRILTRFSIIFAWPAWVVVMIVALICAGTYEAFKALFK